MKKILSILGLLVLALSAFGRTDVSINLTDARLQAAPYYTNRTLWITPMSVPNALSPSVVLGATTIGQTDTNGVFVYSNAQNYVYQVVVRASPNGGSQEQFKYLVLSTNLGFIYAADILSAADTATFPAGSVAWAAAVTDSRYAKSPVMLDITSPDSSLNLVKSTNNGYITMQAFVVGGGGGGGISAQTATNISAYQAEIATNGLASAAYHPASDFYSSLNPSGFLNNAGVISLLQGYVWNATNISGIFNVSNLPTSVTLQGNTFNNSNLLVQLDNQDRLPASDASLLTNLVVNSISKAGVVPAGSGHLNQFWMTDGSGNPGWNTYAPGSPLWNLIGSGVNNSAGMTNDTGAVLDYKNGGIIHASSADSVKASQVLGGGSGGTLDFNTLPSNLLTNNELNVMFQSSSGQFAITNASLGIPVFLSAGSSGFGNTLRVGGGSLQALQASDISANAFHGNGSDITISGNPLAGTMLSNSLSRIVFLDATNGNDAWPGTDPLHPVRTIAQANTIANGTNWTWWFAPNQFFDEGTNGPVFLNEGSALIGNNATIYSTNAPADYHQTILYVSGSTSVRDINLVGNAPNFLFQFPVYLMPTNAALGNMYLYFDNVNITNYSDGFYAVNGPGNANRPMKGHFFNCKVKTGFDAWNIALTAQTNTSEFWVQGCRILSQWPTNSGSVIRGIVAGPGTWRIEGNDITVIGMPGNVYPGGTALCIQLVNKAQAYIAGNTFLMDTTNVPNNGSSAFYKIQAPVASQTIAYVEGHPMKDSEANGNIVWLGDATNAPIANGIISTDTTNRFWTLNGGSLTNVSATWGTNVQLFGTTTIGTNVMSGLWTFYSDGSYIYTNGSTTFSVVFTNGTSTSYNTTNSTIFYGDKYDTNALWIGTQGVIESNALGSITLAGTNITDSGFGSGAVISSSGGLLSSIAAPANGWTLLWSNGPVWSINAGSFTNISGGGSSSSSWSTNGNANTVVGTTFLGTTDGKPLEMRVNNTRFGLFDTTNISMGANNVINLPAMVSAAQNASAILGGGNNTISNSTSGSDVIVGGTFNLISSVGADNTVLGGIDNAITNGSSGTIAGGEHNRMGGTANDSDQFIAGGISNYTSGSNTFAAGKQAFATNAGAFVWADSIGGPFGSTNKDEFNVRAHGGVKLYTSGAGLWVDGSAVPLITATNNFTGATNIFNTVVATNLIINGGATTTVSNLNVNGWGTVQGTFTNGGPAYFSNSVVALPGGSFYGLVPSGAETNAAGSRVAYLSDVGGSGGGYNIDTSGIASNATAEVAVWTNSHLMTTTNSLLLESWIDLDGPTNYLAKHWDSYFRDQTFIGSNTITSFSSATNLTARWALLNSTGLVLYVKGYTNESLNYTARAIERTCQTNGVVTTAAGADYLTGLVVYYNSTNVSGVSGGGVIHSLTDLSGNNNGCSDYGSGGPYFTNAVATANNSPGIVFTNNALNITNIAIGASSWTVFVTYLPFSGADNVERRFLDESSGRLLLEFNDGSNHYRAYDGTTFMTCGTSLSGLQILEYDIIAPASGAIYTNGVSNCTGQTIGSPSLNAANSIIFGNSYTANTTPLNGIVFSFRVYAGDVTPHRTEISSAMRAQVGL